MPNITTGLTGTKNGFLQGTGLGKAPVTGNKMYDDLFSANPYRNLTYNQSSWQSFLSALGFRTDFDRWKEQAQVNSNEYDAQVASLMQQNEYNSEVNKVEQMKDAGLNPDLLGTSGVADSASPTQDVNGMSPNEANDWERASQFASGVLNCFGIATGLAKDMLSFKQMSVALDNQDIDLASKFMDFANDYVLKQAPAVPFESDDDMNNHISSINHSLVEFPRKMHFNRRQRRIWNQVRADFFSSGNFAKITDDWKRSKSNLNDITKTPSRIFRSYEGDQWKAFNIVASDLGSLADEVQRLQMKNLKDVASAGSATAKYQKAVSDARLGYVGDSTRLTGAQTQVMGEMKQSELQYQTAGIDKAINSTMSRIVTDLERQANEGDLLSAGLLLAFNIFRMSNWKVK